MVKNSNEGPKKKLSKGVRQRKYTVMLMANMTNDEIAAELGIHRNTVSNDLKDIEKRIVGKIKETDEETRESIRNFIMSGNYLREEALRIYGEINPETGMRIHPTHRLAALNLIHKLRVDYIKAMQSLGVIKESPKQIEGTFTMSSVYLEMQDAFDDETKRQRKEGRKTIEAQRKRALDVSISESEQVH